MKSYEIIHPAFTLNGIYYDKNALCALATSFLNSEEEHERNFGQFVLQWFDEKDFIELTTSGTTGKPKLIQLKKEAMVNSALATATFFDLKVGCTALHCMSTQYIAGKMMLVRALICGWQLDVVKPVSNPLDGNSKNYDFAAMVPLQVEKSMDELYRTKKLIIGGAKLNPIIAEKLKGIPSEFYETYGMTETITHIAAKKIQENVFKALPNVVFSVDERSCLVINAPSVSDEKLITNDIVGLISEHEFIWKGRFDNVINSGGVKLFPEQIEEKLIGKINSRFFVIGQPDELLGEKLILVVEGESFEIENSVFDSLGKFEKPKEIVFIAKFTETETGKIKRKASLK
ncbi:AMP-binding protein [Flavobacterium enshiense]|uniref:AMP-binding protein n=1 Tax=Flavobacterium enshiense TaxID=1341165 RepID=UPI00345DDCC7